MATAGAAVLLALGLVWFWARSMMSVKPTATRQVPQVVQLIRPPPPVDVPPPPPPPPEKVEEQLPQNEPDQPADSPAEQLGLDADASAGGDSFGLVARKGGADLLGTGSAIFGRYTSLLKDTILDKLLENDRVRRGSYSIVLRVWVARDGQVSRVALTQSSGQRELDSEIERQLTHSLRVNEAPPLEMPQPVTLKITSRG